MEVSVIPANVETVCEMVEDSVTRFVVTPRNVDAIVEKLELLRGSLDLRAEMGRDARQRAQEFTWNDYRKRAIAYLRYWLEPDFRPLESELQKERILMKAGSPTE